MSIRLSSVMGNSQKLDGGAMFGNAPKALWTRWAEADELNRIDLACRALLVETPNHKILFETGIGVYMEPKLRQRYGVVEENHVLLDNLAELGLDHTDITDLVLSHLHFDHAGGMLSAYEEGKAPQMLFPNARIYAGKLAWDRANNPHPRDRASFVPELNQQIKDSGRLQLIDTDDCLTFDTLELRFFMSSGHTPGMICSDLQWQDQRLVFAADLIPGTPWVHLPITMGYDRFPEGLIEEKRELLHDLHKAGGWLFFTHDARIAASAVNYQEGKHRFSAGTSLDTFARIEQLQTAE